MMPCACSAKERIVGFYSTGPKIKENDLQVGERTQQQQHPTPPQAAVAGVLDRGGMPWRGGLPIGGGGMAV